MRDHPVVAFDHLQRDLRVSALVRFFQRIAADTVKEKDVGEDKEGGDMYYLLILLHNISLLSPVFLIPGKHHFCVAYLLFQDYAGISQGLVRLADVPLAGYQVELIKPLP